MVIFAHKENDDLLMSSIFKKVRVIILVVLSGYLFAACKEVFDVHPYDMRFDGEGGINATQIAEIKKLYNDKDTLRIAFISDTHGWYTETKDEIANINSRSDIDFVIHCGDLTDTGTTKEYEAIRTELDKLNVPYIALIGNHDFLGTGDQAYEWMFGSKNFSFIVSRIKFVCLDTNAMEYDRVAAVPDFDYMEEQMVADSANFDRTILVMHAAPYSDEFNNNVSKAFNYYTIRFKGLMFCVYGHDHVDITHRIYEDGPLYYGIDCALHRNYKIFTITPDGYEEERIDF